MPVEFIGMIGTQDQSEIGTAAGPVDRPRLRPPVRPRPRGGRLRPGADRLRPPRSRTAPQVAAYAAAHTERLGFLVAHRPGFVAPTLAARTFATLDQFTGGRVAVHIITGGNDAEQRRDGDYLTKDERYARTDEYLDIAQAGLDQRRAVRLRRRVLPGRGLRLRRAARPAAAHPDLLRRLVRGGLPGRRQARRHVRAVGRAAGRDRRADRLGPRGRRARPGRTDAARHPRLLPPDPRRHRGAGLGAGAPHPRDHQGEHRGVPRAVAAPRPGRSAATRRRTSARSGCSPPRPRASCTTARCGPRSPPPPAPPATPPRWSARRRRSPRRCSTTSTSA